MRYKLPRDEERGGFLDRLQERFPIEITRAETCTRRYFDTFDWRLFRHGLALCRVHDSGALWTLDNRPVGERFDFPDVRPFVADWSDNRLKTRLTRLVSSRALIERTVVHALQVEISSQTLPPRPAVNLKFEDASVRGAGHLAPLATHVDLVVYPESSLGTNILAWVDSICSEQTCGSDPLASLCAAQQQTAYSSKLAFRLDADMPCIEATRTILVFLLGVVHRNMHGVLHDIDTEFLHDFRVAVRRARSLLGQFPGVLRGRETKRLREGLRALGGLTNRLRDLDVLLLQRADYMAVLPVGVRSDMQQLFERLRAERDVVHHRLLAALQTERCETVLERWHAAASGRTATGPAGNRRLRKFVRGRIRRQCRHLADPKYSDAIETGDTQGLHRLRIECKKLRYLFEFFISILPADETAGLIRRLRTLQDVLGRLHDLDVQEELVHEFSRLTTKLPHHHADRTRQAVLGIFEPEKRSLQIDIRAAYAELVGEFPAWLAHSRAEGQRG